jgi:hypothetical protein
MYLQTASVCPLMSKGFNLFLEALSIIELGREADIKMFLY